MNIKVNFIGRLGADAEIVTLPERTPFITFRAVVNERINKEDVATWLTVTADYEKYKNMAKYLTKGTIVSVGGTERCSLYTSKNGTRGIDRKVVADYIEFANFGKRSQETEEGVTRQNATTTQDVAATVTTGGLKKKTVEPKVEVTQDQDDDLPF